MGDHALLVGEASYQAQHLYKKMIPWMRRGRNTAVHIVKYVNMAIKSIMFFLSECLFVFLFFLMVKIWYSMICTLKRYVRHVLFDHAS